MTPISLSIDESVSLDWHEVLERLATFATADLTREQLKRLDALATADEAARSMKIIEDWSTLLKQNLRPQMTSLDLFAQWHQRLARNAVLRTLELKDVRNFCQEVVALRDILEDLPNSHPLLRINDTLMAAEEPLAAIDQIMTPAGDIRTDASERLYQLNIEKTQLARQVQVILDKLVKSFKIEHLVQDRYVTTREGRWVLPIRSGMQHGFEGIIHDSSQTKQTVFMEPQETIPINNRLREIEIAIEEEVERLLSELSKYLAAKRFEFEESKGILLQADTRLAEAKLAMLLRATPVNVTDSAEFVLRDLRHPLLVLNAPPTQSIVANTVELNGHRRILLLSGPNAGGKTVLLKAIGLAAQMARCGLPVCTGDGSRLPFFTHMVVALGDSQSVDANLSTFAAHLRALERAVHVKGENSLILIDEICGSTDPEEGAALARSFIETYQNNGLSGVITSHLGALKRGWDVDSSVVNGSLEFNKDSGPTYRFILGVPGPSLAIQAAERIGIASSIIQKAKNLLSPEARRYQEALGEIDQMKKDLLTLRDEARREKTLAEKARVELEQAREEFAREKEARLSKELKTVERQVEDLLQEAKAQEIFQKHDRLMQIKRDLPEIVKARSDRPARSGANSSNEIRTAEDFLRVCPPGTSVYIQSLDRTGIVQGRPNARDEVPVLSNSMRLMLSWRDLRRSDTTGSQNLLRKFTRVANAAKDGDRVMDIRGLTVEDAISRLEQEFDTAAIEGADRLKIIHGHGTTDALKRGVRTYLSRSPYVKNWQAGTKETGGDGITWVELN